MRVLGTQRAKQRHTAAEVWFRQRLVDENLRAERTALPGLAYFGLDIPLGGGQTQRADVVLFTPTAVIVVVTRILPWFKGGTLRAPLTGPWTFEGIDTRFDDPTEPHPGATVNRLVFALREHLRRAGLQAPVRGMVCIAGPRIKVRQERLARRHCGYLVCAGTVEEIVRTIRETQGDQRPQWTPKAVLAAMRMLGVQVDLPDHQLLSAEGFTAALPPAPTRQAITAAPLPPQRIRFRRGLSPRAIAFGALVVPSVLCLVLLGMVGQWLWAVLPSEATVAGVFGEATSVRVDGLQFEEQHDQGRVRAAGRPSEPMGAQACSALAEGEVRRLLDARPCEELRSRVYATMIERHRVAVTVTVVRMPDDASAAQLTYLLTAPTGGTLNDPDPQPADQSRFSEVTATRQGADVVQTRARFVDGVESRGAVLLRRAGQAALRLA